MTERDLHKMLWLGFINEGIHEDPMAGRFMMSGPGRYDVFNMGPTDTQLKMGDTLLIDGGPRYKGYFCDIQRNICIGMTTDEIKRMHKMSIIGQEAALNAVKPGAKASDIYFAAKRALKELDPKNEMLGAAGHGIGLYSHELPVLDAETETEIMPGMCLAVEVATFDHGCDNPRFCNMMPEDNIIVTESGYENLSGHLSKELWLVK
jgi:Xaa-Pro aminopeptidase